MKKRSSKAVKSVKSKERLALEVSREVSLSLIRLERSECSRSDGVPIDDGKKANLTLEFSGIWEKGKEGAGAWLVYLGDVSVQAMAIPDTSISISATYRIVYKASEGTKKFTKPKIEAFQVQAFGHVWPYVREFVQSTTTRMGLPPLTLPLLAPAKLWEQ